MGNENFESRSGTREGVIERARGNQTLVVVIESVKAHPRYHKVMRRKKKVQVHDPKDRFVGKEGVRIRIVGSRPVSRSKRCIVVYDE